MYRTTSRWTNNYSNLQANMDSISEHLELAKDSISNTVQHLIARAESYLPTNVEATWKQYVNDLSRTSVQDLVNETRALKVTPATVTLLVTTTLAAILAGGLLSGSRSTVKTTKDSKKKKKPSKAQKANKEIQKILDFVEETYVPQIDDYIQNYASLSDENKEYKFKYFEEMLLKELMKLDDVDVAGNNVLRDNRKKVIKFVQEHQTRLDKFKKEH